MSEFELSLIRQRSEEAIRQKARRGELQFLLPVGFCWTSSGKIEKDPDERVQQAIELVGDSRTRICEDRLSIARGGRCVRDPDVLALAAEQNRITIWRV